MKRQWLASTVREDKAILMAWKMLVIEKLMHLSKLSFLGEMGEGGGGPPNGKVEVSSLTIHRFVSNI